MSGPNGRILAGATVLLLLLPQLHQVVEGSEFYGEGRALHLRHRGRRAQGGSLFPSSGGDAGSSSYYHKLISGVSKPKRSPEPRVDEGKNQSVDNVAIPQATTECTSCHSQDSTSSHGHSNSHNASNHSESEHHGIHVASWNWEYVETPFIYTFFVVLAGMCKVGFHHADFLSSLLPESCLLILLGTLVGGIVYVTGEEDVIPNFESRTFFLFLLPPIMLESAYSLHDRAFADNLGTVLLYAVVGTLINCFTIGPTLYGLAHVGAMGSIDLKGVEALVFSALISAVDPVAVLAIFQEVGVNKDLYFLVFGESLLNDAVTVVLYNMMVAFTTMDSITADQIGLGVAAFFCVSLGGLFIGIIIGMLTAFITKFTEEVRVVEPLAMLGMAYLSYLTAEMVHFSGIISIIGCGLVQAQYAIANISDKSYTTVKYFSKMLSATCDCIIFFFLGMVLVNDKHIWHTGFVLWTLFLCLLYRFCGVFILTFIVNRWEKIRYIDYEEQFIMAYGGLRGAVCFSLVVMLDGNHTYNKNLFITATLVVILFTVFIQGGTIKPLVKWLEIQSHKEGYLSLTCEINTTLIDHVMAGVEEITGERGENYIKNLISRYDEKYLRKWLQRSSTDGSSLFKVYEKLAIQDHYAHLYGPSAHADSEKQMKIQSTCGTVLLDDSVASQELEPALPTPPQLKPSKKTKGPACPFAPSMFENTVKPKGKVSMIAQTLVGVGQTVASPLMMDSQQATQTFRKALRHNYFNKFHQKYNPNLIRDDEQEIGEQLRLRRMRARRLTMAALSPSGSNQSSQVDLTQIPESESEGWGLHNDRSRSQSLAATTEILAERARQRRKQNLIKAHTVDGDAAPLINSGKTPQHRQISFIRNGGLGSSDSDKSQVRHSAGELEMKGIGLLDPIKEHDNGDDDHRAEAGTAHHEQEESAQDETSPFLEFKGNDQGRRSRLSKEQKIDLDDPETTV